MARRLVVGGWDDAAFEGEGEGVEGWLPTGDPSCPAPPGRVQRREREGETFEGGLLGREVAASPHRSPDAGVERLDGVGAADDATDFDVEGEERHELGPRAVPQPHDGRV